uniref:Uncharacterized protein n=1 Tax=Schistosoma curassoni TaxID=6186 RepID=A0A183L3F3_9TREM
MYKSFKRKEPLALRLSHLVLRDLHVLSPLLHGIENALILL